MKTLLRNLSLAISALGLIFFPVLVFAYDGGVKGEAQWGTLTENIFVGRTISVGLEPDQNSVWYISGNTNPEVAEAIIFGNSLIMQGKQAGFSTAQACTSQSNCVIVSLNVTTEAQESGNVLGATTFNNGQLVKSNKTIYAIYKNTKTGFTNLAALKNLSYLSSNIISNDISNIPDSGYLVTTSEAAHPFGAWILDGQTIYFVHELGLIPVADWSIFINNHGSNSLLVNANQYDMQLPILSVMRDQDSRLK